MTGRDIDLRVCAAPQTGFVVWEAGELLAAFTSRAEVAEWIEKRLGDLPGEREREAMDFAATQEAFGNVESMPKFGQPRTAPKTRNRFFGGAA